MKKTQSEKAIIQLCIKQKHSSSMAEELEKLGISINENEMDVLGEILDLIGVPEDTMDWETEYNKTDSFCRDWLMWKFSEMPIDKIHLYPSWVRKELSRVSVKA